MGFFRLITAMAIYGVAKTVEKTADLYDEVKEELKNNPPESFNERAERYKREVKDIQQNQNPDPIHHMRLEAIVRKLDNVPNFLSPLRKSRELDVARRSIDSYYDIVKMAAEESASDSK